MKEDLSLVENLPIKDRVYLAIDQVNGLTREIAVQMGEQWEIDRFGKYKSEHMIKMANESDEIISNYKLDKNEELIEYLPLFRFICRSHDLGRHFYDDNKYIDKNGKKMDHGEISVILLKEREIIKNFSDDEQRVIEYIIKNHSLKEIDQPIDETERKAQAFCLVFRDIDKLEVLNKKDFIKAKEIYRLLGIHFDLGEDKIEWKYTDQKEKNIDLIQDILDGKEIKTEGNLESKIKQIVNEPLQENVGNINIIEYFESGKSMPMNVYRETKSYANYLLYLFSYLNGIKYIRTLIEVDQQVIKEKMDFLKSRTTQNQYKRIKSVLTDKYFYQID